MSEQSRIRTIDAFRTMVKNLPNEALSEDYEELDSNLRWYESSVGQASWDLESMFGQNFVALVQTEQRKLDACGMDALVLGGRTTIPSFSKEITPAMKEKLALIVLEGQSTLESLADRTINFITPTLQKILEDLEKKWGDFSKLMHSSVDFDLAAYRDRVNEIAQLYSKGGTKEEQAKTRQQIVHKHFAEVFHQDPATGKSRLDVLHTLTLIRPKGPRLGSAVSKAFAALARK